MNLSKLFELQRRLDERIEREHPVEEGEDRLAKKILALQVKLGALANEWRGFKFWSNDQEPRIEKRTYETCPSCNGEYVDSCWVCGYSGQVVDKIINPLLEEYLDCLRFALSVGLELNVDTNKFYGQYTTRDVITQFNNVFRDVVALETKISDGYLAEDVLEGYKELINGIIGLGEMLGFTWEQVEQAYMEKNQ